MTSAVGVVLAYYGAVLVGLEHWNKVISWQLITAYAPQLPHVVETLGISLAVVPLVAGGLLVGTFLLLYWRPRAVWAAGLPRLFSPSVASLLIIGSLGVSVTQIYAYSIDPPVDVREPVSLTIFLEHPSRRTGQAAALWNKMLGHENHRMNEADAMARADYRPNPTAHRRNVILIVGDALRPDHMSIYGYHRETTPFLTTLAQRANLRKVDRMSAVCAESLCGLLAILQGRYVHEFSHHGFTLHEVLRIHGYRTSMILSGDHTNYYGLRERYGSVDEYFDGSEADGYYFNDDQLVVDYVDGLSGWDGRPVFMQFHLMSSHGLGVRREEAKRFEPAVNYYRITDSWERVRSRELEERVTNFYDNGVLSFDGVVADLIALLEAKGYLDDALVVVTSDHGELLGEHGELSHARTVYEEVLRIPLLLYSFGESDANALQPGPVSSQTDISPTILRELDMPIPATWSGRALQDEPSRDVVHFQQGGQAGIVDLRDPARLWKYVFDADTGEETAYDVTISSSESWSQFGKVPAALRQDWNTRTVDAIGRVLD